jgi:hypothetical protein
LSPGLGIWSVGSIASIAAARWRQKRMIKPGRTHLWRSNPQEIFIPSFVPSKAKINNQQSAPVLKEKHPIAARASCPCVAGIKMAGWGRPKN